MTVCRCIIDRALLIAPISMSILISVYVLVCVYVERDPPPPPPPKKEGGGEGAVAQGYEINVMQFTFKQ